MNSKRKVYAVTTATDFFAEKIQAITPSHKDAESWIRHNYPWARQRDDSLFVPYKRKPGEYIYIRENDVLSSDLNQSNSDTIYVINSALIENGVAVMDSPILFAETRADAMQAIEERFSHLGNGKIHRVNIYSYEYITNNRSPAVRLSIRQDKIIDSNMRATA